MPSFSSSLLDAIYHSIDEKEAEDLIAQRRNYAAQGEEEIQSLRRAIMIEKWMENYRTSSTPRHLSSNSGSSTDSSIFSSSETESSVSRSTPKSSALPVQKMKLSQTPLVCKIAMAEDTPKHEGRFRWTKSKAMKIYGDLKKAKEPISQAGKSKITSFLNSIFSPRNLKKGQTFEVWSSLRKSRSMKDSTKTFSSASRSCLSKNPSSKITKSKRSVKFCPVSVIVDEDCQPCGHKNTYDDHDQHSTSFSVPSVGSQFIKKNIDSFRLFDEKSTRRHEFRELCESDHCDLDDASCTSSDLFELDNIDRFGSETYGEELPVYGTTSIKVNNAIARGLPI